MAVQKPKKEKYLTTVKFEVFEKAFEQRFDDAMASIARSFDRIEERLNIHDTLFETIIQMFHQGQKEHEEFRKTLADHAIHISRHEYKIDNVTERLEIVEKKIT